MKLGASSLSQGRKIAADRSDMFPPRRVRMMAALLVLTIIGTVFVVAPQPARADANAPRWTQGDFWLYVNRGNPNHTIRVEVVARENTRTLLGNVYEAWHVKQTDTNGSIGVTTDLWITDNLAVVNRSLTIFVLVITTYEPPQVLDFDGQRRMPLVFPLAAQKSWTASVNSSVKIGDGGVNTAVVSTSAQVEGEVDVTVPAGTLRSFVIRGLGAGAYTKLYYSEQAGYWSKQEDYNAQDQKTREMTLSTYRYQWGTTFLLIIVGLVLLAAIAVVGFVVLRRRRGATPRAPPPPPPTE
jgi:hypothetical protein